MTVQFDETEVYDSAALQLVVPVKARRGTSNGNVSGSSYNRRARKLWLLQTYRADVDVFVVEIPPLPAHGLLVNPEPQPTTLYLPVPHGDGEMACRCYRCGALCVFATLTVDRIKPGCQGGTYRRDNIRPCCGDCNSHTGGKLAHTPKGKR